MAEKDMRKALVKALKPLDAIAVENSVGPGTPDVECIEGWIECKWLRAWPKRPTTPVRLDHELLQDQKVWLRRRIRRGGDAWVMLQCRREWLLFRGNVAADYLGNSTREELYDHAEHIWTTGLDATEIVEALTGCPIGQGLIIENDAL